MRFVLRLIVNVLKRTFQLHSTKEILSPRNMHLKTMFPQQRTHVKYNRGFFTLHILLWCYTLEFPLTN